MEKNTKTHNGDSKKNILDTEEATKLKKQTDECTVVVAPQSELNKKTVCKVDLTATTIQSPKKIKDGLEPQEESMIVEYAAELGKDVITVLDRREGKTKTARTQEENLTQKASREKLELEQAAEKKYEQNNSETEGER